MRIHVLMFTYECNDVGFGEQNHTLKEYYKSHHNPTKIECKKVLFFNQYIILKQNN